MTLEVSKRIAKRPDLTLQYRQIYLVANKEDRKGTISTFNGPLPDVMDSGHSPGGDISTTGC